MAVSLKWKKPSNESSYSVVYIYKADSENGEYIKIAEQGICDNTYYDNIGTNSNWYKIRFYDYVGGIFSEYSDPIQGGNFYAYCTIEDVRATTNITERQVTDNDMSYILKYACTQLNSDINTTVEEEKVDYVDEYRQNVVNGTNTTFYTKNRYLGDKNNDFIVNVSDLEVFYVLEGVRYDCDVSSINAFLGKFILDEAPPTGVDLYVSYVYVARRVDVLDTLIREAAIFATAMWCYSKLNVGKATRFHMGNLTVFRDTDAYNTYRTRYHEIVTAINASNITKVMKY